MPIVFDDMSPDDLQLFITEADEQLELLESDILRMEQGETGAELIQEMFRAAHTLKGSAATLGHRRMTELAHAMENVMDKVRKNELAVSRLVTEVLFVALDGLKLLKEEVGDSRERAVDLPWLVAQLGAVIKGEAPAKETEAPKEKCSLPADLVTLLRQTVASYGGVPYTVAVTLSESCFMGSIRMFQAVDVLKELGRVLSCTPSEKQIEGEEDLGRILTVHMVSLEGPEQLRGMVSGISEIEKVLVAPVETAPVGNETTKTVETAAVEEQPSSPDAVPMSSELRKTDLGPQARGKPPEELKKLAPKAAQTVRVDVERLDNLMNLVGELVISRTRLAQLGALLRDEVESADILDDLSLTSSQIGRITQELQAEILKARMLPIDTVFSKFPRMIRDLAQQAGKEVNFLVEGKETELDRSVIEVIGDPLIHILRNAVDHGLEPPEERALTGKPPAGTLRLVACHEENHIVIRVEDDGRGIDAAKLKAGAVKKGHITQEAADRMDEREALNLIFVSGLSTAKVVSDISGRGVGMDIVKNNIEKLNGSFSIDTTVGKGTRFTVRLPLTLAIIQAMLVEVAAKIFAIPLSSVNETIKVERKSVRTVNNREVVLLRGKTLPLIWLRQILRLRKQSDDTRTGGDASVIRAGSNESFYVVVVGGDGKRVGFVVDGLVGKQEVVIKNMGRFVGDIRGFSGATILGSGSVALILDVPTIIDDEIRERMSV